jgi:DNA-binding XRE family transcriptional regulator
MKGSRIGRTAGRNIRKLREARGWSCEDLGKRVGLTRGGVSAIEVGRVSPPLDTCERFARAFGVPLSEIIPMGAPPAKGRRPLPRRAAARTVHGRDVPHDE